MNHLVKISRKDILPFNIAWQITQPNKVRFFTGMERDNSFNYIFVNG